MCIARGSLDNRSTNEYRHTTPHVSLESYMHDVYDVELIPVVHHIENQIIATK